MSDAQRRWVGRIAFALLCLLPTAVAVNWALFPRSIGQWQTLTRQLLGCPVDIGWVETPTPHQTVFRKLRLRGEPQEEAVECDTITWQQQLDRHTFELAEIELSLRQFTSLAQHVWTQLPRLDCGTRPVELHLPRVAIRSDLADASREGVFTLTNCWMRMESNATQTRLTIEFFTESASENPVRWEVIGRPQGPPTRWSLQTNGSAVPSWLIAEAFPAVLKLGDHCKFVGYVEGELTKGLSTLDVVDARLLDVDPARLVDSAESPQTAANDSSIRLRSNSGCTVLVKNAHVANRRLESVYFEVHCEGGAFVSGRLLNAAKRWLSLDLPDQLPEKSIELLQLAFAIEIRDGAMCVYGQVPDGQVARGADNQPLVFATPSSQRLAPYCLAGWIADGGQIRLPVSAASLEVLSHLPILR